MTKVLPILCKENVGAVVYTQHVTPWLTFRNKFQCEDYNQYRSHQSNIYTNVLLQIFCTGYFILSCGTAGLAVWSFVEQRVV